MEWTVFLTLALGALAVILFSGVPVFVGFLLLNTGAVVILFGDRGFGLLTNSIYTTATSSSLMAIPLFILVGELLFRSGSIERLSKGVDALFGRIRGRSYYLTIAISTVFGALSGSAIAVTAVLGRSVLPTMLKEGYDKRVSGTMILGGASLSPIIPPSLIVVIVGSLVGNISIGGLLVAGIGPGILIASLLALYCFLRVCTDTTLAPEVSRTESSELSGVERLVAVLGALPFVVVVLAITGFILFGITTPSESAATGVIGAVLVAALYRTLSWEVLKTALGSTVRLSSAILIIVASSQFFGQLLSLTGTTRGLVESITALALEPWQILILLMLIPLVLCMFIDQIAFLVLAVPLYEPVVQSYGFDPIWFWTLFIINLTIGSVSPPFGYNLFTLRGASAQMSMRDIYASAWPVVAVFLGAIVCMAFFPAIVTTIPEMSK